MRRRVLAQSVRSVVEKLESRTLLSATFDEKAGTANLVGTVYNDLNSNGVQDAGEPVISGATVTLTQPGVVYPFSQTPTVQTDANGTFGFANLAARVVSDKRHSACGLRAGCSRRVQRIGERRAQIAVAVGETAAGTGGTGFATLTGVAYNDYNQDNAYNPNTEDFLSGDTVYLDTNGNGVLDVGEPSAITNNIGIYSFTVQAGSYAVRVVPRPGFHQDPPGFFQVNVASDSLTMVNVGENNRTTVSGIVYEDLNGNGVQDPGEPVVPGETVYLDSNLDNILEPGVYNPITGQFDPTPGIPGSGEANVVTDANGQFVITGLTPGPQRLKIMSAMGMVQNGTGFSDITVAQGQDFIVALPEGTPATVSGVVFNDANANGVQDAGEVGLPNQQVFLDLNNNGVFDMTGTGADGLPLSQPEPTAMTDSTGAYSITGIGPGTYTARAIVPAAAIPTGPLNPSRSYTFTLGAGQPLTVQNFGLQTADLTVTVLQFPTKPTLTGVRLKSIVRVTNVGSLPSDSLVGVTLYASTTPTLDINTASLIGLVQGRRTKLKPGQSKLFKVTFAYPTQLPLNSYYVTARVVTSNQDNNTVNDYSAPIGPVQVGPPYIDLSVVQAGQPPLIVDPGQATGVSVIVTNNGNVTSKGELDFRFYTTLSPQVEPTDVSIQRTKMKNVRLKPGQSKVFNLVLPYPGQNLRTRYIIVQIDSGDALGETNVLNNFAYEAIPTFFS